MNTKLTWILALFAGVVLGQLMIRSAGALYEQDGGWSATEKRQVIGYLEDIARNTSR